MDTINELLLSAVSTPWVYFVVLAVALIDAFFPPIPSESVVIAAAVASVSLGQPNLVLVILAAAAGAIAGDNLTFTIGRLLGVERFKWMRRPRIRAAIDGAGRGLERRATVALLTARYIPVGRVAVNLVAGATGMSRKRFFGISILAGTCWALYSVVIGTLAGSWFGGNTVAGIIVGIVLGIGTGLIVDAILGRISRRRAKRAAVPEHGEEQTSTHANNTEDNVEMALPHAR
jgi:membrane protein DedA with SNARE-associated domain